MGHAYGVGGGVGTMANATVKGDYSLVVNEDASELKDFGPRSSSGSTTPVLSPPSRNHASVDFVLNHPALPIFCYCISSIFMTVVNKVCSLAVASRHADTRFRSLSCQGSTLR